MKKTSSFIGALAVAALLLSGCNTTPAAPAEASEACAQKGAIVYFDLDKVLEEYDMANDLRSALESKVSSISEEVNRRQSRLEKDINDFQSKIDKGLLTRSVAEVQGQKLQEQQANFQQYAAQKQQEIAEEQQVVLNQIADAIHTYLETYNAEKQYAMIITTQGGILPAPVAVADPSLNITDDLLAGLNDAYVKEKAKNSK